MSVRKAPDFEKKPNCQKCNTSFGMFTRQHHCRNCGKSYCEKCSSKNVPIPHYGFVEPVRVCDGCYITIQKSVSSPTAVAAPVAAAAPTTTRVAEAEPPSARQSASAAAAASSRARSDSGDDTKEAPSTVASAAITAPPPKKVSNCVCGLPFCICPPDKEEKKVEEKKPEAPKPKAATKTPPAAAAGATQASTFSSFGFGAGKAAPSYDLKGDLNEQCRDAIKAKDHQGVVTLLGAKADARFIDRTGNSLVHLAAMFDQLPTVTLLIKNGANIWDKNPAGETAVDLAPPSLAHKMKELSPAP